MPISHRAPVIWRRHASIALAALPLALAGCHSSNSVEARNETPEAVASKVAASGIKPRAGRWEATVQVEKMELPGMTPQMRAEMQKGMMQKTSFASCLTQAEADKPEAGFFQSKDNHCKFDKFSMADGKIDAKMTCSDNGRSNTVTMAGTYTPDSYKIHMDMAGSDQGNSMSMAMTTQASRVGACKGNEDS